MSGMLPPIDHKLSYRGLIFDLGTSSFKIYHLGHKLTKIGQIEPTDGFLNLDSQLENLWQNLWPIINLETQIFYLIQPKSGFTSSRVVYLWLQSWQMFATLDQIDSSFLNEKVNKDTAEVLSSKQKKETFSLHSNNFQSDLEKLSPPLNQFYLQTLDQYLALELYTTKLVTLDSLYQLLAKMKTINNQNLTYSAPVRIGHK